MEYIEGIRTLVVDDSEFFGSLTADKLESNHGIETETATSAQDGLERLQQAAFDCVVSDYDMPEMDGLEFYKAVDNAHAGLPFIILTGRSDRDIATEAIEMGVDDFLQKESVSDRDDFEVLANRVENVVSQRKSREKFEVVVENIPEAIAQIQLDGTIIAANEAMSRATDLSEAELVGSNVAAVLPDEVASQWQTAGEKSLAGDHRRSLESTVSGNHYDVTVVPVRISNTAGTYQVIARDISARVEREQKLEATTAKLELINRLVRHDIRNDINVISQWAQLLESHLETDEQALEYVERIQDSSEHIVELTNISQEFVQLLSAEEEVSLELVPLRKLLLGEIEKCRMAYEQGQFEIGGTIPAVDVRANEMLVSVFRNLLNNAVQHNDTEQPTVEISAELTDEESVVVTVADDGPGIPENLRDEIFGRGRQGPESAGTGIGLYLVDSLVSEYGGSVHVEDSELGGAAFVVELPIADG